MWRMRPAPSVFMQMRSLPTRPTQLVGVTGSTQNTEAYNRTPYTRRPMAWGLIPATSGRALPAPANPRHPDGDEMIEVSAYTRRRAVRR